MGTTAVLPAMMFFLVYWNLTAAVFGGFQLETLQSFFVVLAAAAAIESLSGDDARDAALVGLACGCAAMLKPTGLAVACAFVAVTVFARRKPIRQISSFCLGIAAPLLVTLCY